MYVCMHALTSLLTLQRKVVLSSMTCSFYIDTHRFRGAWKYLGEAKVLANFGPLRDVLCLYLILSQERRIWISKDGGR
jgi:hypothetical protein